MPQASRRSGISVEDYLDGEVHAEVRHEYVNGAVYAMVGFTKTHNRLTQRLSRLFGDLLEYKPCEAFAAEVKAHILAPGDERFLYPDLLVECEPYTDDERYCDHPVLVIEVLSESTERYDRSDKYFGYRKLRSQMEYVLVAQDVQRIEVYRRDTAWDLEVYGPGERLLLRSIDAELTVNAVYKGVVGSASARGPQDDGPVPTRRSG